MRKLLLLLLGVAILAVAGAAAERARPAATASQTVTISKTGYTPTSVSISAGDAVVFMNSDTVAHTVDFKSTTGMHCTVAIPLVVGAGQSASCTFSTGGKFNFSDPAGKGKNFHGTVTVAAPLLSSFTSKPRSVVYGRKATLAGVLASGQAGQSLQILAQQCGGTATTVGTVTTTTGGAFSYQAQPLKKTSYAVKDKNTVSGSASVQVRPRLHLGKVARHRYVLRVFAGQSFAGKYATFQRYRPKLKHWRGVKRIRLRANTTGVAPTVVTSAKFRSRIKSRQRVRVVLGKKQVGACYLASRSNAIRS